MDNGASLGAEVRTYFAEHVPASHRTLLVRVTNALLRGGIVTMEGLRAASDEKIRRVRNLGDKCFEVAVMMRGMYAAEAGKSNRVNKVNKKAAMDE